MRRHKKLLTRIVLCLTIISTLLGTFSIFSGAATATNVLDLLPQDMYYNVYGNQEYKSDRYYSLSSSAEWILTAEDRIVFAIMGTATGPWHLVPYIQGQETSLDAISYYNNNNSPTDSSFVQKSSLVNTTSFDVRVSYSVPSSNSERFLILIQFNGVEHSSAWQYDWKPMYVIEVLLSNSALRQTRVFPYGTTSRMSVFENAISYHTPTSTFSVPSYSGGVANRWYGDVVDGLWIDSITMNIEEYYYPVNLDYPTNPANFQTGLYKFPIIGDEPIPGYFKSYPFLFEMDDMPDYYYEEGFDEGYSRGEEYGYQKGYLDASQDDLNAYTVPELIITFAQLPASLISSMLDFDVFGVNVASTVKVIFTTLFVIFIVVVFLKFII